MKKSILKISLAAMAVSMVMVSCKKDSSGTTDTTSQVSFGVSADNSTSAIGFSNNGSLIPLTTTASASATITWTSGIVNITQFKLEAKKNGKDVEIVANNLTNVDLFALSPGLVSTKIDTGKYKDIEIRVILTKAATGAIPLTLKSTFTTLGGATVPVEFDYNDNAIIKTQIENVTVDAKTEVIAKLKFHLNTMLSTVAAAELDKATRNNGTIVISSTSNPVLYAKVILNIIRAFEAPGFEKHKKI